MGTDQDDAVGFEAFKIATLQTHSDPWHYVDQSRQHPQRFARCQQLIRLLSEEMQLGEEEYQSQLTECYVLFCRDIICGCMYVRVCVCVCARMCVCARVSLSL